MTLPTSHWFNQAFDPHLRIDGQHPWPEEGMAFLHHDGVLGIAPGHSKCVARSPETQ